MTTEKLKKAKKAASVNYENAMKNKFVVYLDLQNSLLFSNHYTIQQRANELEKIDLKDLNKLMDLMFNKSKRDYLIQGNYTVKDANKFFNEIEFMFKYEFSTDQMDDENLEAKKDGSNKENGLIGGNQPMNKTYNVKNDEDTNDEDSVSAEFLEKTNRSKDDLKLNINANELFPKSPDEYYCLANLSIDSPEPVLSNGLSNERKDEFELSICNTPNSGKSSKQTNKRFIESTSLKNAPTRKLFLDSMSCTSFNASKIEKSSTISRLATKSNSQLNSICIDTTNRNYNLSPLNNTNDNFSKIVNKDSQIIGNLYFTWFKDDAQHSVLLSLLVELIKQNMNAFFTNEGNCKS